MQTKPSTNHPHMVNMTILDYFAAEAMSGFLTGDSFMVESDSSPEWIKTTAAVAYAMAEAMMKEREITYNIS